VGRSASGTADAEPDLRLDHYLLPRVPTLKPEFAGRAAADAVATAADALAVGSVAADAVSTRA
jgi:hypothetical protein